MMARHACAVGVRVQRGFAVACRGNAELIVSWRVVALEAMPSPLPALGDAFARSRDPNAGALR